MKSRWLKEEGREGEASFNSFAAWVIATGGRAYVGFELRVERRATTK
jgi:hypothetical protein